MRQIMTGWHHTLARARGRPVRLFLACAFWSLVFALLGSVLPLAPLELAENALQDAVVRHGVKNPTPQDLVFLALDESSLDLSQLEPDEIAASRPLTLMQQEFPWSRAVYAEIIEKILGAGAKAVVLDIHFPSPGDGDEELRAALDRHGSRVVIASLYENTAEARSLAAQYRPPSDAVLPSSHPRGIVGYASFWPEPDNVVRVAHYRVSDALLLGELHLRERQLRGRKSGHAGEQRSSLAAVALRKAGSPARVPDAGLMRFCEPGSFPVVPLYSLFVPDMWQANLQDGAVFRDKIVLLGPTAGRFRDFFRTPVGTRPGPEIHLHAIAAAAAGAFYTRAGAGAVAGACLVMGLIAWIVNVRLKRPLRALGLLGLVLAAYAGGALVLYNHADFIPGLLYPSLTLVFAGLTSFGYDFSLERREKLRVRRSLERYVSRDVVRELLDSGSDVLAQLGGTRKDVAVLFSDLRGFTALSENAEPAQLVADLNEYLGGMVEIVFRHRGTLDKFIGDAVMAVWGTVESGGRREDATRAVRTALDMLAAVARLRAAWAARGAPELHLGIGIHYGPAIFGNIGSELKMEPTVIGDTVNLASRLESLTKRYGVELLVSEAVVAAAGDAFPFRTIDTVRVVGRTKPVTIYTAPAGAERPVWLERHEEGWGHYRAREFREAAACFAECAAAGLDDASLRQMTARCADLVEHPPAEDWEYVTRLESK